MQAIIIKGYMQAKCGFALSMHANAGIRLNVCIYTVLVHKNGRNVYFT